MTCKIPGNTAPAIFDALITVLRLNPTHDHAEVHVVNLVSILAVMPKRRACVALVDARTMCRYEGFEHAVALLANYNITLERTWHKTKPAFFLFAQLHDQEPGPAGAPVVLPKPEPELEMAA